MHPLCIPFASLVNSLQIPPYVVVVVNNDRLEAKASEIARTAREALGTADKALAEARAVVVESMGAVTRIAEDAANAGKIRLFCCLILWVLSPNRHLLPAEPSVSVQRQDVGRYVTVNLER
jgi:hypothetical protein